MKLTKIYTKTGDNGATSLVGGIRIGKDTTRLEAYGTIDELSSHIGLLDALLQQNATDMPLLQRIQCSLFNVGTYLATDTTQTPIYDSAKLNPQEITVIEQEIDSILPTLPQLNSFILPGGSTAAAQCHICRTVCRRAERCIIALSRQADINPDIIKYINRLSDYFFVLARKINILTNTEEKLWQNTCK
ncbi:MAG: cob(I)yrinic acid a,c-diamide adenosyltransferase [Prevotella sp.]|nr:cob(I)yrinic acid a,c-diamide adenosyltransferase [Candidatus Prevotella equi]